MIQFPEIGSRVSVRFYDAVQVGRLDRVEADAIYVDGVRIRLVDIRAIEIN